MAVLFKSETNYGVDATFYQITGIWFDFYAKEVVFSFSGYVSEDAAKAGKWPIDWKDYHLSFDGARAKDFIVLGDAGALLDIFKGGTAAYDVDIPQQAVDAGAPVAGRTGP